MKVSRQVRCRSSVQAQAEAEPKGNAQAAHPLPHPSFLPPRTTAKQLPSCVKVLGQEPSSGYLSSLIEAKARKSEMVLVMALVFTKGSRLRAALCEGQRMQVHAAKCVIEGQGRAVLGMCWLHWHIHWLR